MESDTMMISAVMIIDNMNRRGRCFVVRFINNVQVPSEFIQSVRSCTDYSAPGTVFPSSTSTTAEGNRQVKMNMSGFMISIEEP